MKTNRLKQKFTELYQRLSLQQKLPFAVLTFLLFISLCVKAQTTSPSPQQNTRTITPSGAIGAGDSRDINASFRNLSALEIPTSKEPSNKSPLNEITRHLYRKPSKDEMKVLIPSSDYLNKYVLFLKQPNTGIIKLNSDSSCAQTTTVIAAKEKCLPYSMPGAGTAYSFRLESHRIPHLADLILSDNVLKTDGVLQQGILVKLGDVPLDDITLQSNGLKYLTDFVPSTDAENLANWDRQLIEGIKVDGFVYGLGLYATDQTTYALRSIAYKGKVERFVNGITYNEFDFDKRRDIIVAFRILEKEPNGNIIIAWKSLSNENSPTLKIKQIKEKK